MQTTVLYYLGSQKLGTLIDVAILKACFVVNSLMVGIIVKNS